MIGKFRLLFRLLFSLGIVMLFLPFLGIPNTWKMIIAVLIGITLIRLAFFLKKYHAEKN